VTSIDTSPHNRHSLAARHNERHTSGVEWRDRVPIGAHGEWQPPANRPVNGERVPMFPGDLVLTPNWSWHDLRRDYSLLGRRERMRGATIALWRPVLPFRYASLYGLRSSGTGYSWSGYLETNRKKETSTGLELP